MRKIRLAAILVGTALLVGGAVYAPASATESTHNACLHDEAQIRAVPQGVVDSWARADAAGIAAQFTSGADFISGDGQYVHGSAALEQFYVFAFQGFLKDTRSTAVPNKIVCESRNIARIITLGGILFPGDTEVRPEWRGIQTWLVVRQGHTWKAQAFHNTRTSLTELPPD